MSWQVVCRCGALVPAADRQNLCPACRLKRHRQKPSSAQRGYGSAYRAMRKAILAAHPVCHWCGTAPSTQADHVVPLAQGGTNDLTNLVGSCAPCNARRGAALANERRRRPAS